MIIENTREISQKYIDKFETCKLCGSKPIIKHYFDDIYGDNYTNIVCPNHEDNKIHFNDHLERMCLIWNRKQPTVLSDFIEKHFSVKNWTKELIANVIAYFSESWFIKYANDMIYVFDNKHDLKYIFKNYGQFTDAVTAIEKDKYE